MVILKRNMHLVVQKILLIAIFDAARSFSVDALNFDSEISQLRRPKRLIWALPLTDSQSPFDSPRWFANLYWGNFWSRVRMEFYRLTGLTWIEEPEPRPARHLCGGSMLTPTVVGTACHCVGYRLKKNDTFDRYERKNGWEQFYAVFVGYFTEKDIEDNLLPGSWAWSRKFLVHEHCGKVFTSRKPNIERWTHDFGLVILDKPITFPKPGSGTVPVYSAFDILKMFNYIQQRESICLTIGFGAYNWVKRGVIGPTSPVMMHGWRNVRNYWFCHSTGVGKGISFDTLRKAGYDYFHINTAVCHTFFGKIRNHVMKGDSGGPVTCDNFYVGLNSRGNRPDRFPGRNRNGTISISWFAAIAFTLEWHSAQYRQNLLSFLDAFDKEPEVTTKFTIRPWIGNYYEQAELNGSSTLLVPLLYFAISVVLSSY